jgi:hypothetical protein
MKRAKWAKLLILVLAGWIVNSLLTSGCAGRRTFVLIDQYKPQFTKDWNIYKGKSVYLMNFDNQANDTSIWYYFSSDLKYSYGNNYAIHNYFWYAFSDAFVRAGMRVSSFDNPDLTAPSMWVTLRSITDERYQVRVTVQNRGATSLIKDYTIQEQLPPEPKLTREEFAQRAYKMTNQLIETILGDPEFQKVITESSTGQQ